ncbi:hypothetical protein F5B22DRAFT_642446 [Xylaria bambusicola]|uniref:uncharacterized protein n=1 Tax=Xylaria bambusicola TaxID=326684 RepID=UPI002007B2F4|nr:uncharacterized protein F5B22DRAFT_642446 [Xylaria bambusicola]KAI0525429.1 hypothetical protein F5B22DRAFT_642446 [Xylaria bambusicola]
MVAGLDELIESLLTEIAFSGVRGCSIHSLLAAIDLFYKASGKENGQDGSRTQSIAIGGSDTKPVKIPNRDDLAIASKVWRWLADRSDVSIGTNRQFNHLSLEEALALPEEEESQLSETTAPSSTKSPVDKKTKPQQKSNQRALRDEASSVRPRLHVSEERQWRTIAGHGPDLKRVPLFEWRALVDIASVKEKGILQGDLVRLTGQDKRSLPTRTDALARKGYIIKQPVVLRGGKSSKLWLAQFSEYAREHQEREGLDYDKLDLSKAALTSDLDPVSFCDKWNGDTIDYLALAQGFVAIVKAWTLIRYCDARAKLGVEERVRQMRALAKTCRWLTNIGALSFVGAKFAGSNRLFKDCVKYIRDPSPAEWSHFRATPKTRMVVPSGRIGKRGEASRAVHASQPGGSRGSKTIIKKPHVARPRTEPTSYTSIIPSPWKPQKPVPNTAFEIIKRAGSKGTSNAAICRQTLGHNYRRLTAAMTGSISMPTNSQPSHLKHLSSTSQLSRIGKTMTYTFYACNEILDATPDEQNMEPAILETNAAGDPIASQQDNVFSQVNSSRFFKSPSSSLSDIVRAQHLDRSFSRKWKRKRPVDEDIDDQPPIKLPRRLGRPPKRRAMQTTPSSVEGPSQVQSDETPITAQGHSIADEHIQAEITPQVTRAPGVYRGLPNSLDPVNKRGRRRKSLVIIFRSDKLKDPAFLGHQLVIRETDIVDGISRVAPTEATPRRQSAQMQDVHSGETPNPPVTVPRVVSEISPVRTRTPKSGKRGSFRCDKCGNSWKNSNGLEYHLTKSRTSCNQDFVPPPSDFINSRQRKSTHAQVSEHMYKPRIMSEERRQHRHTLTPGEQIESRLKQKEPHLSSSSPNPSTSLTSTLDDSVTRTPYTRDNTQSRAIRGSIVLKNLDVFDVTNHRRFPHQQSTHADRNASLTSDIMPVVNVQASIAHSNPPIRVSPGANTQIQQLAVFNEYQQADTADHSQKTAEEPIEPSAEKQAFSALSPSPPSGQTKKHANKSSTALSGERLGARKPLPNILPSKVGGPSILVSTLTKKHHGAQVTGSTVNDPDLASTPSKLLSRNSSAQSTKRSLESFARPTKPNASFGARRRDRTIQIIGYLLDQNGGVFPGLRSLFMAVISVWAKEFKDLAPPDRRICQNIVNQMERDKIIKQMHFFFFDDQAKMQECVVLAKTDANISPAVDSTDDPRVIAVKEKMREMFPEAYVPDPFSLSPDEAKLFDELASQGKEHSQARLKIAKDLKKVQDIETLRYENSVMDGISTLKHNAKRQIDEAEMQPQPKKTRVSVEQPDLLERARKLRRRPDKHEMWDSGKLAVYIWSQRQKPSTTWDQNQPHLQDPVTGAWSWAPEIEPLQGNISTILSSVKSARHIDASLKQKRRRTSAARSNKRHENSDPAIGNPPISADNTVTLNGYEHHNSNDPSSSLAIFAGDSLSADERSESYYVSGSEASDSKSARLGTSRLQLTSTEISGNCNKQQWPDLQDPVWETCNDISFANAEPKEGTFQSSDNNMPRNVQDILSTTHRVHSYKGWADPTYGDFLRNLKTIKSWEQSADGSRLVTHGPVAQEYVYISLTLNKTKANMKPTDPEWLVSNQFTIGNVPDEIKNSSLEDADYGLAYANVKSRKSEGATNEKKGCNERSGYKTAANARGPKPKNSSRMLSTQLQHVSTQPPMSPSQPDGFIEYKTRDLTIIPKQPRGRFNKPAAHDDKLGSKREDELVAACVVFRTLLGGLDRNLDIGLLLKHFPGMSLSALKKFWPRVSKERKSYVQALTAKFQSGFLKAYENGTVPPLDYDNIDNYDWPRLILWATQLETHEDVDLPESREILYQSHVIEDITNEAADWRDVWFATTSTYNRIEAVASETMSIPLPSKFRQDKATIERARTWVRSICCTPLRGVDVKEKLVPKLLELGDGDVGETNRILEKVVAGLNREKVITRTKGKDLGGNFRIHGMFSKQLEKMASTSKVRQAISFKAQLDEVFRHCNEHTMPYASDDGSIMAVLNLQAHGRIRTETIDMQNIPFGFEPGNYEGRTFPKSYYHFKIRLSPTDTYLFNDDMALLDQAQRTDVPTEGPDGRIPIWVDFFGNVNVTRWVDYVSMIVFTLAIKGPIVPKMCVTLLKPMIEEFEVQLIVEWLDKLGLIQQAVDKCGVTVAEWWWLVAGYIAQFGKEVRKDRLA